MARESSVRSCKDLEVWRKAMDLTVGCYKLSSAFPKEETDGLSSQIRRAFVSIAANIAEGWRRESTSGFLQYLRIAQGSTREQETHLILVERLKLAEGADLPRIADEGERVSKMLRSLIRSLNNRGERNTT